MPWQSVAKSPCVKSRNGRKRLERRNFQNEQRKRKKPRRNKPLTAYQRWVAGNISLKDFEAICKQKGD